MHREAPKTSFVSFVVKTGEAVRVTVYFFALASSRSLKRNSSALAMVPSLAALRFCLAC